MAGDPSLTDDDLQREIDLVGALVLAASQTDGPLSQERIDEILGVDDPPGADADADAAEAAPPAAG
ncbi:hypothetical protein H9L10_00015 [Phycicoccus endophyticus]|uniref:Uncharacterized protein n=1 Tax=Phycicoccus endophyticus TaxID=1690220 RepID=A0A7G9R1U2_9MICO|nr:hypothetical protein [Phycicoccus endophyticus]NHI18635.1 hypothetical protein [Phycicoccus endophyticus]QNN49567.1 hypothetical protein H9L10_00015 [Phycicoccus endophyticus]GGL37638.1 hypothetical protein GCM10012283_20340 [Phycicoccus endophyticus]